ncbi:MAG: GldG family protein, partial [Clostridiaceae bacterium]|nr:GldG family protein [Clostridiaceae bacterium]
MKMINKKSLKFGSYAFMATVVIIAIIVIFNALLGLDSIRDRLRLDITKNQLFSLSEPSITMLDELEKDVEVIILTDEKYYQGSEILEVIKQYDVKSNGKVKVRFVDVEKDPTFVEREIDPNQVKGISEGSIVVKSGKNSKVVSKNEMVEYDYSTYNSYPVALKIEQAFSSAIKSVTADFTPVIYFATGHGEMTANLSELKSTITANNYEIKDLSLANAVPEDAATIFFVSPKTDLLPGELENLLAFMEKGGDAIFLMDVQNTAEEIPNFDMVFERYSLALNNDIVLEGDQNWYMNEFTVIIPQPNENDVTINLDPKSLF